MYNIRMALFVNQENTRTKLQQKIAADLKKKKKKDSGAGSADRPDGITDSAYLKNTKQTTSLAWAWVLIVVMVVGVVILFVI